MAIFAESTGVKIGIRQKNMRRLKGVSAKSDGRTPISMCQCMAGVDYNVNSGPKVSGTCFGKFEKSIQIDPKMVIFGPSDGCLIGVIGPHQGILATGLLR